MSSEPPPKPVIAQRYRLIEKIGHGGMGSVWRAEHTSLRTPVAIKLLNSKLAGDTTLRARFLREAQSAAALSSSHIVRILDHGVDDDLPYIAMEFLAGESLRDRLRRVGRLTPDEAAPIFAGVARGMARAHRVGIVHRDLKPDNIFINRDEEVGEVAKIVDFGIAKLLDDAKLLDSDSIESLATVTGTMLGTPYYMSPEQLRGKKEIDARADLWAIGVIAFECLTGRRPFVADAIGELVLTICSSPAPIPSQIAEVPKGFDAWFARAVTVAVDERFQHIHELAHSLADVLSPGQRWLPVDPEALASAPKHGRVSLTPASTPTPAQPLGAGSLGTASTALVSADDPRLQSATGATHAISSVPGAQRKVSPLIYVGGLVGVLAAGGYFATRPPPQPSLGSAEASSSVPRTVPLEVPPAANGAGPAPSSTGVTSSRPSSSAEVEPRVAISFEGAPPGAEILRDGKKIGTTPEPITVDRGTDEIAVTLKKSGYIAHEFRFTPDGEKKVRAPLQRVARPGDVLD